MNSKVLTDGSHATCFSTFFPDDIERNTLRDHRAKIYEALKGKLPADQRIRARNRTLLDYDRAINGIRKVLEKERGTHEVDFYQPEIKNQWFAEYREGSRKNFASWLDGYLKDRGLRLNQSGRDTSITTANRLTAPC